MIGSHVVDALVANPDITEVRVLDAMFAKDTERNLEQALSSGKVSLHRGDVREPGDILPVLEGVTSVFHLAAVMTLDGLDKPDWIWTVNANGFFNVLNAARLSGVQRVVVSSSTSAYGDVPSGLLTEDLLLRPATIYGATKAASEALCSAFSTTFGIHTAALRYGVVYGPRLHRRSKSSMVITNVIDAVLTGQPVMIPGDGSEQCEWIYVGDVAKANIAAMESDTTGESFNIGSGFASTTREVVDIIFSEMGVTTEPTYQPFDKPVSYNQNVMAVEKAEKVLGFRATTDLRTGIRAQIEFQKAELARNG